MANLKDIRTRIDSVKTTRQVTSAMKMVSAAKLKKAQDDVSNIKPYVLKISELLVDLARSIEGADSLDFAQEREAKRVLYVPITSNKGLCGAFNSNVIKETIRHIKANFQRNQVSIDMQSIGKQGMKLLRINGENITKEHNDLFKALNFDDVSLLVDDLMSKFLSKEYDRIYLVYNEFVNAGTQRIVLEQFLPIHLPVKSDSGQSIDYIFEPDRLTILQELIPNALRSIFWRSLLDSVAAEHGARMTSMHKATDNASDLISELQLTYNKARQANITNEILEIVGGAEALKK